MGDGDILFDDELRCGWRCDCRRWSFRQRIIGFLRRQKSQPCGFCSDRGGKALYRSTCGASVSNSLEAWAMSDRNGQDLVSGEGAVRVREVRMGDIVLSNSRPVVFISGPCQIESRDHAFRIAEALGAACRAADMPFIFKSSYDKANRTSLSGARGVGIDAGLTILDAVRRQFGCPVLTDVHSEADARAAGDVVDVLQIPAFLCRQTDLLLAAGKTGKAINVKKGQFMAPWDIGKAADKIASTGNENITLCERGVSFGYNTLVTDFRALPIMRETGYPVVFDATHSVQEPSGKGGSSGGKRQYAPMLARAACVIGVSAVFAETHNDPDNAPSDGPNMLPLEWVPQLLDEMKRADDIAKSRDSTFGL